MTQQEIIEQIQQVHPEIGETQLRLMLNTALDEFAHRARLNEKLGAVTVVADQRYYDFSDFDSVTLDDDVLEVLQVTYGNSTDGEFIMNHFLGEVEPIDTDEA